MKARKKCDILMLNHEDSENIFITKLVNLRKNDVKEDLSGRIIL